MENNYLNSIKFHIIRIAISFIDEITPENVIFSFDNDESIAPDPVANHHLIELLSELNRDIFYHYCSSLFQWLADSKNHYNDHPFTLDSYTKFCLKNEENYRLFKAKIANHQLKDGSIPIYTALREGGDFFSTLWATKILINYDKKKFKREIEKALDYLIEREEYAATSISQTGFLFYLLLKYNSEKYEKNIKILFNKIFHLSKDINFKGNIINVINELYLIEDLIEYINLNNNNKVINLIENKLNLLLQLDSKNKIPEIFKKFTNVRPQSPYYQLLLKSALVGLKFVKFQEGSVLGLALDLNNLLLSNYTKIKYLEFKKDRQIKLYKLQYGDIEKEFKFYENSLREMWKNSKSDYEHSIFLMMPFKSDLNFRELTNVIKKTCKKYGFKAFRVDDDFRKPFDTLWDNIVINMLGCKYGISIYVTDKSIDRLTDELRFFENPNVALEFGFMKSRGKKILILKDINSKTPSDLQGFLWRPFDLKNPDLTVPKVLEKWLKEIQNG